ncbi:hypothetical protein C0J52_24636 [Blattella germanica]|nr:hypothetical protein C0J52_24636 [Blattella germanica]
MFLWLEHGGHMFSIIKEVHQIKLTLHWLMVHAGDIIRNSNESNKFLLMQENFRSALKFRMNGYLENSSEKVLAKESRISGSEHRHPTANSHSLCLKYSIIAFVGTSVMLSVGQSDACK